MAGGKSRYRLIGNFEENKKYDVPITPRICKTFEKFPLNEIITPNEFAKKHQNDKNWLKIKTLENAMNVIYLTMRVGKKIGIIEEILPDGYKTTYDDFISIPEIHDWLEDITPMSLKRKEQTKYEGTRGRYAHTSWKFNDWLIGKEFEFKFEFQLDDNTFKRELRKIKLTGLVHFLKLLQKSYGDDLIFKQIVKQYLRDSIHKKKGANAMRNTVNVIKAFFVFFDTPLLFSFNHNSGHKVRDGDDEEKRLTLSDFFKFLTVGKPTISEKAVFMCKFHRGLDNITFTDRFNYEAFPQLVKYFGSEDHNSWDLKLCPVPIDLIRTKVRFKHRGFLDWDAVASLQDALEYREKQIGTKMKIGDPIFLTKKGNPITNRWVYKHFTAIADRAKIRHIRKGYDNSYNIDAHESRDLLKSVAKECKVDADARDHFIGHKPKDSYEKEAILYPDTLRKEFIKMSKKINVFSKFTAIVNGTDDTDVLTDKLNEQSKDIDELLKITKEQLVTKHQDNFFARNIQQQLDSIQESIKISDANHEKEIKELKSQIESKDKNESEKLKFGCTDCMLVHDKKQCPICGSNLRGILEDPKIIK